MKRILIAVLLGLTLIGTALSTGARADIISPPPPPPINGGG